MAVNIKKSRMRTLSGLSAITVLSGDTPSPVQVFMKENKMTLIASGGAIALILVALFVKKRRKKSSSAPVA